MTIGVALFGTGSIAAYHADALAALPGCQLRLAVGRDATRTAVFAQRYAMAASTDLDAALARTDIDAVVIATPDDTHEAIALKAAAAGKAALLQKPMAPDVAACKRIRAAFENSRSDLQVGFMHRYFEEVVAARSLLAAGSIGEVVEVRLRNATPGPDWADWFFDPARVAGGVVHQLGVHGIDLLLHMFGPIVETSAWTAIRQPHRRLADGRTVAVGNPDCAWARYRFASGLVASHEMSMVEAAGTDRFAMEIFGKSGTLRLRGAGGALGVRHRGDAAWSYPSLPKTALGLRHHRQWLDGLAGRAPAEDTATAAIAGLQVVDAVLRSAASHGAATTPAA
jgi:predicted dehydrogenase